MRSLVLATQSSKQHYSVCMQPAQANTQAHRHRQSTRHAAGEARAARGLALHTHSPPSAARSVTSVYGGAATPGRGHSMAMSIGRVSLLTATLGLVDSTIARVAPPAACARTPPTTPRVSAATVETAGTCRPVTSYNAHDGTPRCAVHECGCRQAARTTYVLAEDVHVADASQARRHVLAGSDL